jgi:4-aminobutyrate aminotransferase
MRGEGQTGLLYQADLESNARLQKLRFFPLALTGGAGRRVIDESGRSLLDLSAAWGAASLGYGHPRFVEAVTQAARNPAGASVLSAANKPAVELAQRLLAITPARDDGPRRVWLGHSGSDANETVARVARAATCRPRIISFVGAYHGGTAGSMAISGHSVQAHATKDPGLTLIPYPDPYRPFQGDATGGAILDLLERRFSGDLPPTEVAALFLEPIQSDGGMVKPPPEFFARLASLCARHGILVVCDEVKVGLGRSGRLHCFEHEGFVPDIVTFGKGLGGGLPLSAIVGPARVMDYASSFSMQTLHGNPIAASAGLAVLETIEAEDLLRNTSDVGAYLQLKLQDLAQRRPMVGDVRGRGLAIGVELVTDRMSKTPASGQAAKTVYRCFELGVVLYYVGMSSNVLELTPSLNLTRDEVDEAVDVIGAALADVADGRVPDSALAGFEGW